MQIVSSTTLSLRSREIKGDDARHYYELFPALARLTQERETELVSEALSGSMEAADAWARQDAGLGISTALRCRYQRAYREVDIDSLISAALLGVVEGIRHFDTGRGSRLVTCIWWWVMCYIRRERIAHRFVRNGPTTYLSDFSVSKDGSRVQDECAGDQRCVLEKLVQDEEMEEMHRLMDGVLNARETEILSRRYTYCKEDVETFSAIGKSLNVSRQRVSQIEEKAVEKLRRAVGA